MNKSIIIAFQLVFCCAFCAAQETSLENLAKLFDYDRTSPLELKDSVIVEQSTYHIHDISFASPRGGRVTAFLITPKAKGPHPAILFGHWGHGNRTEFLPEAELYAQAGVVSLLIDYPWVRPAPWRRRLTEGEQPDTDRVRYIQAVIDLRRSFDLLESMPTVDAKRMAYVGHSYGAQWGAILSAIDKRMKTSVLVGGTPGAAAIWLESNDASLVEYRKDNLEKIKHRVSIVSDIDAIHYIEFASPVPLLFQFAKFEQNFGEPAMNRYYQAASEPKSVKWYRTGHDLNDPQALRDRAVWLSKYLDIDLLKPLTEMTPIMNR